MRSNRRRVASELLLYQQKGRRVVSLFYEPEIDDFPAFARPTEAVDGALVEDASPGDPSFPAHALVPARAPVSEQPKPFGARLGRGGVVAFGEQQLRSDDVRLRDERVALRDAP